MNYRLIKYSLNDIHNPKQTILLNRGIENWKQYLNLNEGCIHDFNLLKNIDIVISLSKTKIIETQSLVNLSICNFEIFDPPVATASKYPLSYNC